MKSEIPPHPLWGPKLARDLKELEARYTRHCDAFPTVWLDYGELDPTEPDESLLFLDAETGRRPTIHQSKMGATVQLGPEVVGTGSRPYEAIIAWNTSPAALRPDWRSLPFFFLAELTPLEAKLKLGRLRTHLEMRSRLYKMRRMGGEDVGSRFLSRLKAYREWCELSQAILREQEPRAYSKLSRAAKQRLNS